MDIQLERDLEEFKRKAHTLLARTVQKYYPRASDVDALDNAKIILRESRVLITSIPKTATPDEMNEFLRQIVEFFGNIADENSRVSALFVLGWTLGTLQISPADVVAAVLSKWMQQEENTYDTYEFKRLIAITEDVYAQAERLIQKTR